MSVKLGRNDPCHCGSGRKYKRCHMEADRNARVPAAAPAAQTSPLPASDAEPPRWVRSANRQRRRAPQRSGASPLLRSVRSLTEFLPGPKRRDLEQKLGPSKALLEVAEREHEILRASDQLDGCRADFERLMTNEDEFYELMDPLFRDERFADLRFTAEEVGAALKEMGYPLSPEDDEEWQRVTAQLVGHIVDDLRRTTISLRLALHLPDLVNAGRLMDAWMVQHTMYSLADPAGPLDPFLAYMFEFGYEAWRLQEHRTTERVLRELGLDPEALSGMGTDDLHRWYMEQQKDPAKWARINEVLNRASDPDKIRARLQQMLKDGQLFFETAEGAELLPDFEDLEPAMAVISERLPVKAGGAANPDFTTASAKGMEKVVMDVLQEAALSVFTPERVSELRAGASAARDRAMSEGNPELAACAMAAVGLLGDPRDEPATKIFLGMLLQAAIGHLVGTDSESPDEMVAHENGPEANAPNSTT